MGKNFDTSFNLEINRWVLLELRRATIASDTGLKEYRGLDAAPGLCLKSPFCPKSQASA